MIKIFCLLALIAFSSAQDVSQVIQDAANAANAVAGTTVGEVVNAAQGADPNAAVGQAANVPLLDSLTVGWGPKEVIVTPQADSVQDNNWIDGEVDVDRETAQWADGEWTLNWSIQDGDDWALLNNNGDLVLVDWTNGAETNLGANADLDAEIASGAEQFVDWVWDSEVDHVSGHQAWDWVQNVINNVDVNNFLSNQGVSADTPVVDAVANAAGQV